MKVSLIGITRPLGEYSDLTPEQFIIAQARISSPENKLNTETMPRLMAYLIRHGHWSPFDLVSVNLEIKTSRAISAQFLRHWSIDWQELSQRYVDTPDFQDIELRKQENSRRQSGDVIINPLIPDDLDRWGRAPVPANLRISDTLMIVKQLYLDLIQAGVARECARMVLPMCTSTTLIGHGTVRSWLALLNVRLDEHTQYEFRSIALELSKILSENFPSIAECTNNFNNYQGNFM